MQLVYAAHPELECLKVSRKHNHFYREVTAGFIDLPAALEHYRQQVVENPKHPYFGIYGFTFLDFECNQKTNTHQPGRIIAYVAAGSGNPHVHHQLSPKFAKENLIIEFDW